MADSKFNRDGVLQILNQTIKKLQKLGAQARLGNRTRDRVYIFRCIIYGCSVALSGLKDVELELRVEELEKKLKDGVVIPCRKD